MKTTTTCFRLVIVLCVIVWIPNNMSAFAFRGLTRRLLSPHLPFQRRPCTFAATRLFSTTNQDLVQEGIRIAREKKQAREFSTLELSQRHLRIRDLIKSKSDNNSSYNVPPLFAVRVSVCPVLRKELKLNGRERRGRLFVELESDATRSFASLKQELHNFFRCLRKGTYVLKASLQDGNNEWALKTDQHVTETFAKALDYFEQVNNHNEDDATTLKRPTVLLYVSKDTNVPPPKAVPDYVQNLPNPAESPTISMVSFYAFGSIPKVHDFAASLKRQFKPFGALGRIYVSPTEGINAQMSVPTSCLPQFVKYCTKEVPELGKNMENGINVDPAPIPRQEFEENPPFTNLHVRVRNQIVADGLDEPLDWSDAGHDLPPMEWHEALKSIQNDESAEVKPIVLDCRNTYESSVGKFECAEPLDTENFRDSWAVLEKRLEHVPKDAPIYTYCTGGIRCVKVGAYLKQEMNFKQVNRLAGGIIAYDRALQNRTDENSLFKGTNFVFDGRLSRPITVDELGKCQTCGDKTSLVSNCQNPNCHVRMVQCESCRTKFRGTCCEACKQRILVGGTVQREMNSMVPKRSVLADRRNQQQESLTKTEEEEYHTLEDYSVGHSTPTPSFYKEMELNTLAYIPSGSHMVSGPSQGQFLKFLASMTAEGRILEVGTFTGYATACLVEGAAAASVSTSVPGGRQAGPFVQSMERDGRAINLAVAHLKLMSDMRRAQGEDVAEAARRLRSDNDGQVPPIVQDSVFLTYQNRVGCEVLRVTDALATLEEIAAGRGAQPPPKPFDMVFLDADKTRLLDYVEAFVSNDNVLKSGGLIVVDNVLWKGLVLQAAGGDSFVPEGEQEQEKRGRRARKLATKMHRFNSAIVKDDRVEVMVLPMRDGLSVIRKR